MRHVIRHFLAAYFLLIAVFSFAAETEQPSMKASVSRKRIFIGDRIRYNIEIVSRDNLDIALPAFKDNKIGDCEVKDSGRSERSNIFRTRRIYLSWLDLTSYYVGKRKIPPIEVKYRQKGKGDWKVLNTPEIPFTVESVLPRGVKLYDIKDIKGPIYPFSFLKLFVLIIAGLFAVWVIFMILRAFKKKIPPKLPHEVALDELKIAQEALASNGDAKEYYVRISDAVRVYIETVFALRASEMTTQEFLVSLSDSPKLKPAHRELLKAFMEACDLVKFAKHAPSKAEIDSVFVSAKEFIEETKEIYVSV